jgi:hypothetical protein
MARLGLPHLPGIVSRWSFVLGFVTVASLTCGATLVAVPSIAGATPPPGWTTSSAPAYAQGTVQKTAEDPGGDLVVAGVFGGTQVFGTGANQTLTSIGNSNIFVAEYASGGLLKWVHRIGNGLHDQLGGVAVMPGGAVFVTGQVDGTEHINTPLGDHTIPGKGGLDIFIARFGGSDGHLVWSRVEGGAQSDLGTGVAVDSAGDAFVVGAFTGTATFGDSPGVTLHGFGNTDGFLAGYNPTGVLRFAVDAVAGGGLDETTGVALGSGNLYVTGYYGRSAVIGTTSVYTQGSATSASYIGRYGTTDGSVTWIRLVRGSAPGDSASFSLAAASDGSLYAGGGYTGTVSFGPPGSTGSATFASTHAGMLLLHVANNGLLLWSRAGDASSQSSIEALTAGPSGSIEIAGHFAATLSLSGDALTSFGGENIFVGVWNSSGTLTQVASFGDTTNDSAAGIVGPAATPLVASNFGGGELTLPGNAPAPVSPGSYLVSLATPA